MSIVRVLTDEQIKEAQQLRLSGFTKRRLAKYFDVSETTIWDNVFKEYSKRCPKYKREKKKFKVIRYKIVVFVVKLRRDMGYNSMDVANELNLPLEEINNIYSNYSKL
jgi:DNA repair photolyase